ncbi:MAG: glycosyltransferase [Solirubrobacteraceae bacterium]
MRLLVLCCRFPEPGAKGDQVRAFHQIAHLAAEHDITVLTGGRPSSQGGYERLRALATVELHPTGRRARALSAATALLRGQPAQVGWMTPSPLWRRSVGLAGTADVVLANTVRSVRGPLPAPLVVDHVDALALNMARRAEGPESAPVRLAARAEAALLRRWERRCAGWAAAQVVTAGEDAAHLWPAPPPIVLPIAWPGEAFVEPASHERDIDVIFTGSMGYPPNRAAAEYLAAEILPRLLALRPDVEAWVVGRGASELRLSPGVNVASDVPDLYDYLRRSKIAVAPLRGGTGAPNKVLEAAACGAALVAAPWVLERFDIAGAAAQTAQDFAVAIDRLLGDEAARCVLVERALTTLQAHSPTIVFGRLDEVLRDVARA